MDWLDEKISNLKHNIAATPERKAELILRALRVGPGSDGYNKAPIEQLVTVDNLKILTAVV